MRLALAPAKEEDPEGKGAGGEDPMREAGAVIERGPCSSRLTLGSCVQSCLSHDKYRLKKVARHKEEGVGGQKVKNSISPETFSTMPVTYLALSEAKKTTARPHRRSDDMALKL
jgi:hypothetical protein